MPTNVSEIVKDQGTALSAQSLSPTALHEHGYRFEVEHSETPKDIATVEKACRNVVSFELCIR